MKVVNVKDEINTLRALRTKECFPIINRGKLWYNCLSYEQLIELDDWYHAWLNVTETKVIPTKPEWLKNKLVREEITW